MFLVKREKEELGCLASFSASLVWFVLSAFSAEVESFVACAAVVDSGGCVVSFSCFQFWGYGSDFARFG